VTQALRDNNVLGVVARGAEFVCVVFGQLRWRGRGRGRRDGHFFGYVGAWLRQAILRHFVAGCFPDPVAAWRIGNLEPVADFGEAIAGNSIIGREVLIGVSQTCL
jgi:hypothetical protein